METPDEHIAHRGVDVCVLATHHMPTGTGIWDVGISHRERGVERGVERAHMGCMEGPNIQYIKGCMHMGWDADGVQGVGTGDGTPSRAPNTLYSWPFRPFSDPLNPSSP